MTISVIDPFPLVAFDSSSVRVPKVNAFIIPHVLICTSQLIERKEHSWCYSGSDFISADVIP